MKLFAKIVKNNQSVQNIKSTKNRELIQKINKITRNNTSKHKQSKEFQNYFPILAKVKSGKKPRQKNRFIDRIIQKKQN